MGETFLQNVCLQQRDELRTVGTTKQVSMGGRHSQKDRISNPIYIISVKYVK